VEKAVSLRNRDRDSDNMSIRSQPLNWLGLFGNWRRSQKNIVVVGSNSRALAFAKTIHSKPHLRYVLKGFVDDTVVSDEIGTTRYPLLADLSGLEEFLWRNAVDEVIVALPPDSFHGHLGRIKAVCEDQGIALRFLCDRCHMDSNPSSTGRIGDHVIVTIVDGRNNGMMPAIKRFTGVVASIILLILLVPLFLVVAFLIKATGPGSVFFVQDRVGIRKHPFRLYKFRTMVPDAEERIHEVEELNEAQAPVFKIRNDPRITYVGRFLRKTSIDELPQLLNVLKGDMNLVGPRPFAIRDYQGITQNWHRHRFKVRPGLTGLWQCNGRSDVSFDDMMKMDIEYVDNWSLLLDFKILLKTVPAVLKGSGAA
jgi:exopolysaccharide biosynthesis polyprenyl glycosylphosphotransferase